jgi:hypothetical protein
VARAAGGGSLEDRLDRGFWSKNSCGPAGWSEVCKPENPCVHHSQGGVLPTFATGGLFPPGAHNPPLFPQESFSPGSDARMSDFLHVSNTNNHEEIPFFKSVVSCFPILSFDWPGSLRA